MEYLIIEVPDMNDSMSRVILDEKYYQVRFTYNDTMDYWSFGLYDDRSNPIIIGLKIVPNSPIGMFLGAKKLPGLFMALSSLNKIGRYDFLTGDAVFIFKALSEESESE